jgi:ABC-type uncharacterized transport system permease subunit
MCWLLFSSVTPSVSSIVFPCSGTTLMISVSPPSDQLEHEETSMVMVVHITDDSHYLTY